MHAKPDLRVLLNWLDHWFRLSDHRRYVATAIGKAMKKTFSIASLIIAITLAALTIRGWQITRPLDHFELDVSGTLIGKLPPDVKLKIVENPDHRRTVDFEFTLDDLPAILPTAYSRRGCVVEFWSDAQSSSEQKLFSVFVDRDLFDNFRVITLRLDKPNPELNPDLFWATQRWSPNLSRRMRYLDLPWWNTEARRLEPIPKLPELIVTNADSGKVIERVSLNHYRCDFNGYYGEIAEQHPIDLRDGDDLIFSVTYDSGGLFETISTNASFRFSERMHKF